MAAVLVLAVTAADGTSGRADATPDGHLPENASAAGRLPAMAARPAAARRRSAWGLRASARCVGEPPRAVAYLQWTPSGAGSQRVDVTVFRDGFSTRRFDQSARLSPARRQLGWRRVRGEALHRWRVLTRVNRRWYISATSTFTGPGCVGADMQPMAGP